MNNPNLRSHLRLAAWRDNGLVLAQRRAPGADMLPSLIDLALANIGLDLLGRAICYAAELNGRGDEDTLVSLAAMSAGSATAAGGAAKRAILPTLSPAVLYRRLACRPVQPAGEQPRRAAGGHCR